MVEKNKKKSKLVIAFAGGGTGGHVRPIQSLIEYIDKNDKFSTLVDNVVWLGTNGAFENTVATELSQKCHNVTVEFAPISSGKLRRDMSIQAIRKNFVDICFRVPRGIIKSTLYCKVFGVDVVFCKGGYVAIPVVIAARLLGIPVYLHESDTKAGLTNKIAHRFAQKSFTAFEGVFPDEQVVGQILSDSLLDDPNQSEQDNPDFQSIINNIKIAHQKNKKVILVSGGSLGSQILYSTLFKQISLSKQLQEQFLFVIVMGMLHHETFSQDILAENISTIDFVSPAQMGYLMAHADGALVRGGTTTLAECKLFQLPLIIVPLPVTHDQALNAEYYKKHYNDTVLDQSQNDFGKQIEKALKNITKLDHTNNISDLKHQIHISKKTIVQTLLQINK